MLCRFAIQFTILLVGYNFGGHLFSSFYHSDLIRSFSFSSNYKISLDLKPQCNTCLKVLTQTSVFYSTKASHQISGHDLH
jgi:hypothetical protein